MKYINLFSHTRREIPSEAAEVSYQLLLRAGYIYPLSAGGYAFTPLGERTLQRILETARRVLRPLHAQEVRLPWLQPAELWTNALQPPLSRLQPAERQMVLASLSEPALLELARLTLRSYRQLPLLLLHQTTRWQLEAPPRAGLLRARENPVLELYALTGDAEYDQQQDPRYNLQPIIQQALKTIFDYLELPVREVESEPDTLQGDQGSAWLYTTPDGDTEALVCPSCGYAATVEAARFKRVQPPREEPLPLQPVLTPDCPTIETLANYLHIPQSRTAKAVFLNAIRFKQEDKTLQKQLVFAIVRGDRAVNETRLKRLLEADELEPASEAEIRAIGAEPGYASPVGLRRVKVIVDSEIPETPNLVAGANRPGYHLLNVNYGRDYQAGLIADIAAARPGDLCPNCGGALRSECGTLIADWMRYQRDFTRRADCLYLDEQGEFEPLRLGRSRLELGRILACLADRHHDEHGLALPLSAAPFPLHIVVLNSKSGQPQAIAADLAQRLEEAGIDLLYDDREESAGVKFNDADLIGLPLRLTVSERSLQSGGIELKWRNQSERTLIPLVEAVDKVLKYLSLPRQRA
jgi:prolyl-tRNA synthetase